MGLFDKLESKLEQGVNGAFARAFRAEVQPVELASGIRRAMDDRASSAKKGKRPIVPNLFTIELSHADYDRLAAWGRSLDDELIAAAQEHADEQRYLPGGPFTIVLTESDDLETGVFHLRPMTARAAEARAEYEAHPRPHMWDDAQADHTPSAGSSSMGAGQQTGPGSSGRGWGSRIKSYLRGDDQQPASAPTSDAVDTYDSAHDVDDWRAHPPQSANTRGYDQGGHGRQQSLGAAFSSASAPAASPPDQADDAYPDGFTPNKRHAWDDDDSADSGAATGLHQPAAAVAPRKMSARERPWLALDGQRIPLMNAITVLGRDEEADVVIDDPGVSRRHSEIRVTHDGPHLVVSIRDLGSTNGTFINGEQVESGHVHDGDALTIGRTRLSIHLGDRS